MSDDLGHPSDGPNCPPAVVPCEEHCHEPGPFGPFLVCEKRKGHKGKWHSQDLEVVHMGDGGSVTTRVRWRVTGRVLGPRFN